MRCNRLRQRVSAITTLNNRAENSRQPARERERRIPQGLPPGRAWLSRSGTHRGSVCFLKSCRGFAIVRRTAFSMTKPFAVLAESPIYSIPFCAIVEEVRPLTRAAEAFLNLLLEEHR